MDQLNEQVNGSLRKVDAPILQELLAAALQAQLLLGITHRPDVITEPGRLPVDPRAVRYNCHFVTRNPVWEADGRVPPAVTGNGCRVLLHTYTWDRDPSTPFGEILSTIEPVDVTVAQSAILWSALSGGRSILKDLAGTDRRHADVNAFRRFLDGIWADYDSLDTFRIESAQHHRANFLVARQVIGLEETRQRAQDFLGYVATSLLSKTSLRSAQLDRRLNRVAAALTVVGVASFMLDVASFLFQQPDVEPRVGIVTAIASTALLIIGVITLSGRRRDRGASRAD